MFFDWKIQIEKVQLTRDLTDDTIIYQRKRLHCKIDQGYCDLITGTQALIVWFPEDTCTAVQVARIQGRMIKLLQKNFTESIPYDKANPEKIRPNNNRYKNINRIETKLKRFQIYPETELACKYKTPLYETQKSEILVEYEKSFDMNTGKLIIYPNLAHYNSNPDENSYIPVTLLKNTGNMVENFDHKTKAVHVYKKYHL